jgi:hypothetical protein
MFNSYVKLPEGTPTLGNLHDWICLKKDPGNTPKIHWLIIMNSENLSTPLVGGMAHFQSQINGLVKGNFMKLPYFIAQKKTWFPVGVPINQSYNIDIYLYYIIYINITFRQSS